VVGGIDLHAPDIFPFEPQQRFAWVVSFSRRT
jgi:hypothetical protein